MSGYVRDASLRSGILQTRRGPAASVANLILQDGEPGYEVDTGKFVVGDGTTPWASLLSEGHGTASDIGVTGLSSLAGANVRAVLGDIDVRLPAVESGSRAEMLATVGEETFSRNFAVTASALTSGQLRLAYFTARRTETINGLVMQTDATAAGATPSLARMGVYSVAGDGSLTLLAATANDTSLFAATGTEYQRDLTTTFSKVAGVTYAVGVLVVSAAAMPTMVGQSLGLASPQPLGGTTFNRPRMAASVTGLLDLPATVAVGSIVNVRNRFPYAVMTP